VPQYLVDQAEGAAVGVVGDDEMVAGAQQSAQGAVRRRHARGEGAAEATGFQRRQALLQRGAGGVAGAGVLEAAAQPADAVLGERRAGVHRDVDCAGKRVGTIAGVHCEGRETHVAV
jgi:hypothetical protein